MSGGEYAELLDKKYYDYDGNSYTAKAEIENTPLYKQLAWCALKETLDKEYHIDKKECLKKIGVIALFMVSRLSVLLIQF